MPIPYTMPQIPNRYPLDKNDKLGLLIGTLLSSGLAAAGSNNTGESPWLRGVAGATAGFGAGGKAINDSYSTMLDDYLKNESMDFRNRQFDQQIREYEETDKPYKESQIKQNEGLSEYYKTDKRSPIDKNKIRDERTLRRLDIRKKQKELSGGGISGEKTTQQLLEEAINEGNAQPSQAKSETQQKGITATNPKTGERKISYDGGVTWQPLQ